MSPVMPHLQAVVYVRDLANFRDLCSILSLGVCRRVVDVLSKPKEKIIKHCATGVQLPCVRLVESVIFVNFCPQVVVLLLVNEVLHILQKKATPKMCC